MIGYLLRGANPTSAEDDPRSARISSGGPWLYKMCSEGAIAVWAKPDGSCPQVAELGEPRETSDGLLYYPSKTRLRPENLLKPAAAVRPDLHRIKVETEAGHVTLGILPFYISPRKILEDGMLGDYATSYARAALVALGKLKAKEDAAVDVLRACQLAIMHSHRATVELIADEGWITESSIWDIWEAVTHVPKVSSASAGEPSKPSSPPAA